LTGGFGEVTRHVPEGFEAYARIFHPVVPSRPSGLVRWADVAAATGRIMHPLAQWKSISTNVPGEPGKWDDSNAEPVLGDLDPADFLTLLDLLAERTEPSGECTFAAWEGRGWLEGLTATVSASRRSDPTEPAGLAPPAPAKRVGLDVNGARLSLSGWEYVLWTGPLRAALAVGDWVTDEWFEARSPDLMWPADQSWLVASVVDFDSTLVGGSRALIDGIVSSPVLEASEVYPRDSLAANGDAVNV
jgi:hypothetical protein